MRQFKVVALFCLAACLGAAFQTFTPPRPAVAKAEPAGPPAVRWRYHTIGRVNEAELEGVANEQAEKGWEVVQVVPVVQGTNNIVQTLYAILFRRAADVKD